MGVTCVRISVKILHRLAPHLVGLLWAKKLFTFHVNQQKGGLYVGKAYHKKVQTPPKHCPERFVEGS